MKDHRQALAQDHPRWRYHLDKETCVYLGGGHLERGSYDYIRVEDHLGGED